MNIKEWYDNVFGNGDGVFTLEDLPNKAVLIVALVVDMLMLFAEYRVWLVGYTLTKNFMLALGFVVVSSIPFYLGQMAWLYRRANIYQLWIAGGMVAMGLGVSSYYGLAEFLLANTIYVTNSVSVSVDVSSLYMVAIGGAAVLIVAGLAYVIVDDDVSNKRKANRLQGKAEVANSEIRLRRQLLAEMQSLRLDEEALKAQYPDDYDLLYKQFVNSAKKKDENPTKGNGNTR